MSIESMMKFGISEKKAVFVDMIAKTGLDILEMNDALYMQHTEGPLLEVCKFSMPGQSRLAYLHCRNIRLERGF